MESLRKLGLLDADGKPLDDRVSTSPQRSPPRSGDASRRSGTKWRSPRCSRRPRAGSRNGNERPDRSRSLGGYAWKALESIGVSRCSGAARCRFGSTASSHEPAPTIVSRLRAWDGSVEQIERDILLRELEAHMTPEEAWIFDQKALGFSSEEIAKLRGSSVNSVDKVMSRLKQKIRALIGVKE